MLAKTFDDMRDIIRARLDANAGGLDEVRYCFTRVVGSSGDDDRDYGSLVGGALTFDLIKGLSSTTGGPIDTVVRNLVKDAVDLARTIGDKVGGAALVAFAVVGKSEIKPILGAS